MGTPDYATTILDKIIQQNIEVVGLFTQPDKPIGRKQIITAPHIKQYCLDKNLSFPIFQPKNLKDQETVEIIKSLEPDFIIVAAYGQILPKSILNIAPSINLHASLLPKYRGASPIQESLLNDDEYSGVTAMMMQEGLDSGDILAWEYQKIDDDTKVDQLFDQLSHIAANLTITVLNNFDNIKPKKQYESDVSYCKKIKKSDGLITFDNAKAIYLKYKAYCYWPGLFLDSGLKIKELSFLENLSQNNMGEILDIQKDFIIVGCKNGTIKINSVQPSGKKAMNSVDYIRGKRLEIGNILS
jgi:methionyl-tRNA formyltransferase